MKQIHLYKKGLVIFLKGFRILLRLDYQTTNPKLSESAFRYSGGFFFSIRFKPHQVVRRMLDAQAKPQEKHTKISLKQDKRGQERTRENKRKIFLDSNLRNSFCSSRHYNYGIYMVQYIFTKKIYYAIKAPNFKIFDLQCNGITTNFWMPFKQQESSARGKHH